MPQQLDAVVGVDRATHIAIVLRPAFDLSGKSAVALPPAAPVATIIVGKAIAKPRLATVAHGDAVLVGPPGLPLNTLGTGILLDHLHPALGVGPAGLLPVVLGTTGDFAGEILVPPVAATSTPSATSTTAATPAAAGAADTIDHFKIATAATRDPKAVAALRIGPALDASTGAVRANKTDRDRVGRQE